MKRRDFSLQFAGGALALAAAPLAQAQGGPVEGTHYVRLNAPAPTSVPEGKKIEVVEFFWYGCPHCYAFEQPLEAWVKKLPADVAFRRVPAGFNPRYQVAQRLYYAMEAMGLLPTLHSRVFAAIHVQNRRMDTESDVMAYMKEQGVDMAKFGEQYKSFQVNTLATRARQLSDAYKIDGVPALGVQGRFWTAGSLAGSNERMLAVADFLIQRSRQA